MNSDNIWKIKKKRKTNYKFLGRIYYSWTSNAFLFIYYFSNYLKKKRENLDFYVKKV